MLINMPEISSERLIYRELEIEDSELIVSWRNTERLQSVSYQQKKITLEEHRRWFYDTRDRRIDIMFSDKETNAPIGMISLEKNKYEGAPDKSFELNKFIGNISFLRKGLAFEATEAVLEYVLHILDIKFVFAVTRSDNHANIRLNLRAGFEIQDVPDYLAHNSLEWVYMILKSSSGYVWIIGGGVLQQPLIKEASELGYEIIVTDADPDCVCNDQASIFEPIDIFDFEAHIRFSDRLVSQGITIEGVLAAGIDAPETMTRIAEHLGLPSVSSSIAHLVHNKDLFRQKMQEIGVPVPEFCVVTEGNLTHLDDIVSEVGYPLIVKNTCSSGSRGTRMFYAPDAKGIKETVDEAISVSRSNKALIESLWNGSEHTVETLFDINGKFHRCFITDRIFDKTEGFALETGLIHPSRLSVEEQDAMYLLAEEVSNKLGVNQGAAKFDMFQTESGPRIIEMTVRLSGGFDCQYLVPAATGKNILKAALLTACGKTFSSDLLGDNKRRVAISESLWPPPGKIQDIDGLEVVREFEGYEYIYFRYNIGDYVGLYNDCTKRVCFIIVSGKNYLEAKENMSRIKNSIHVTVT